MTAKRILILTSDAGLGHRRAAQAIAKALSEQDDNCTVKTINPLTGADAPDFVRRLEEGYSERVVEDQTLYRLSYHALDMPVVSDITSGLISQMLSDGLKKMIDEFDPHVIVSTYPSYSRPCAKAIEELGRGIPVVVVITDLTDVQRIWYSSKATLHFAPTEAIRQQAVENGVEATHVQVTGLPVDPAFARETRDRAALRTDLGWDLDLPTGLIIASPRTSQMEAVARTLAGAQLDLQLVVVCGGDEGLHQRLQDAQLEGTVHLYDWVDDMPALMKASDFIVSKAGGLIVSEALACGLPLIISEALPGQEVGNVRHVVDNDAGAWAPGPFEVLSVAHRWLSDEGARLAELRQQAGELGRPRAAYNIAQGVLGLAAASGG